MNLTRQERWNDDSAYSLKYLGGALLIHVLLGVLLVGFNWNTRQAIVPQLAINAVLVDRNTLNQLARQQAAPTPPSPPSEENNRKQEELEKQRQEQERIRQEQLKQQQLELKQTQEKERQQLAAEAEQKKLEQQRKAEQQKQQQQEMEKKRLADIQQKQREAELKRQADADARAQAEFKAQLAAEEGRANAVNAGLLNQYVALIQQKVMRNWIKPPTARSGLECEVKVAQASGGTVLSVEVGRCNGDAAVRTSIEAAVQRASPLPAPPDPRLFERNLLFIFKPAE